MITSLESILEAHPFFKGLKPEYTNLIVGCASNVRFEAGEEIHREGEAADKFYIIRQGKVAIEIFVPGRGDVTIETLGEGEILGWSWLFPPYQWYSNARSLELTRAIALDGKCLRSKCENDPALGFELVKRLAQIMMHRLHAVRLQLLDLYKTEYHPGPKGNGKSK
jgi:CRP-like cAMP-binding protein